MEGFKPNEEIGEVTGSEIYQKISEIILRKFAAKKKFRDGPSIHKSALLEMSSFLFLRILNKLTKDGEDFQSKTAEELYKQALELKITWAQFEKMVWEEVGNINEYEAVSSGELSKFAIDLFQPRVQRIDNKIEKKKPEHDNYTPSRPAQRWDQQKEKDEERMEELLKSLIEKDEKKD